jgi:hypothetical protein
LAWSLTMLYIKYGFLVNDENTATVPTPRFKHLGIIQIVFKVACTFNFGSEVLTPITTNICVVTLCGSEKARRFGRTYLHLR